LRLHNFFKHIFSQLTPFQIFIPIIIIASVLRLYEFTETYGFFGDQGQDLLAIHHWFQSGEIPLVGILTSLGTFHMGPLYYYSIAPFVFLFMGSPLGPVVLFLLGGMGLVALGYYLCLKFADLKTAIIFSLLLTFSHFLIFLSKGAYSPNLQPLFSIALIYFFLSFLKTEKYKYVLLIFLIIGIGVQFHYLFLLNAIIFGILFLIFCTKVFLNWKFYLNATLGFLIPLIPFLIGQTYLDFQDLSGIYMYLTEPEQQVERAITFQTITDRLVYPFTNYFSNEALPWFIEKLIIPFYLIAISIVILLSIKKSKLSLFSNTVVTYFLIGAVLSIIANLRFFWWYQGYFSITALLIISCLISYLLHYKYWRYAGLIIFLLLLYWQITLLPNVYKIGRMPALIYKVDQIIRRDLASNANQPAVGIIVDTEISQRQGFDYRYVLEKEGIKTYSSTNLEKANYIIVEKEIIGEEIIIPDKFGDTVKSIGEVVESKGTKVKSAEVFKINKTILEDIH
jgi:hypothetical protein